MKRRRNECENAMKKVAVEEKMIRENVRIEWRKRQGIEFMWRILKKLYINVYFVVNMVYYTLLELYICKLCTLIIYYETAFDVTET